jgi:Phosphotransferase enzyme family
MIRHFRKVMTRVRQPAYSPIVSRTVTLVLIDGEGALLGALPPFDVATPWWQEVSDVVLGARERFGVTLDVLRLLTTEHSMPHGGAVSYLAELSDGVPPALEPVDPSALPLAEQEDEDEPLRAPYARLGGPARSIAWARTIVGPVAAVQQRTWNLSAIWRLGGARRRFWLKQLPEFYPAEPIALSWLGGTCPELVPTVFALGTEGRELLADVPGTDLYDADLPARVQITEQAHRFQRPGMDAAQHLVAAGLPDRRGRALVGWIRSSLEGWADAHPATELLAGLEERMAAVAACAVPDTLVHGDANPGNVRAAGQELVFLDWGDCFVGHPGFDVLGLVEGQGPVEESVILDYWASEWRRDVPGCEPLRAAALLRPVACLRAAALYAEFVGEIEPSERRYHAFDVPKMLDAAIVAADEFR